MTVFVVASCSDDWEQEPQNVGFCVRAVWQDGLTGGKTTRALSATNILADGTEDIKIDYADYPDEINVSCKKGDAEVLPLTLTKGTSSCADHTGYWSYTPSFLFRDQLIKREDYKFYATATIDDGDDLEGYADQNGIIGNHLMLTLHHTKALLRFAFKVSEKYDKIRYIRVTNINLNGVDCELVDKVLTTDGQFIAYIYILPSHDAQGNALTGSDLISTTTENTIRCTYNIYDKDEATDDHLTREGVTATNKFTLELLEDAGGSKVSQLQAGYYYDLNVTINPDYLYVLSEHDNKQHITIE